jgi:hypothetical protein
VRNRVAPKAARTRAAVTSTLVRMSVVMTLVPALAVAALVTAAQPAAAAADDQVAAESVSYGLLGPVGIAAVVLGFGGLVAGLLRHRRRDAGAAMPVRPPVEPHTGEHAA